MNSAMRKLAILVVVGMLIQLAGIVYSFWSAYQRRVDAVTYQRAGCERAKKDREGSATLSSSILDAFYDTDSRFPGPNSLARNQTEQEIKEAGEGFDERSKIDCTEAFPDAKLFP